MAGRMGRDGASDKGRATWLAGWAEMERQTKVGLHGWQDGQRWSVRQR